MEYASILKVYVLTRYFGNDFRHLTHHIHLLDTFSLSDIGQQKMTCFAIKSVRAHISVPRSGCRSEARGGSHVEWTAEKRRRVTCKLKWSSWGDKVLTFPLDLTVKSQ